MSKQTWTVTETEAETRLDKWLAAAGRLGSRAKALNAIERGKVFVNKAEQSAADAGRRMQARDVVMLWMDRPGSAERRYAERHDSGLHLLYEDTALLVINKPAGLLTVPLPAQPNEESLFDLVKHHLRSHARREPLIVHRIDRDTSGLVIFAKHGAAQQRLKDLFERREAVRTYVAVVHGAPKPASGTWRNWLVWNQETLRQEQAERRTKDAKEAVCHYRVLEQWKDAALIEVRLETGKRNQIRVQAGLRGNPLVGEKQYLYDNSPTRKIAFPRQALHAQKLAFRHPVTGRQLSFEAPLPEDLEGLLRRLRATSRA